MSWREYRWLADRLGHREAVIVSLCLFILAALATGMIWRSGASLLQGLAP